MNRRSFLSTLASLPIIGRFVPQYAPHDYDFSQGWPPIDKSLFPPPPPAPVPPPIPHAYFVRYGQDGDSIELFENQNAAEEFSRRVEGSVCDSPFAIPIGERLAGEEAGRHLCVTNLVSPSFQESLRRCLFSLETQSGIDYSLFMTRAQQTQTRKVAGHSLTLLAGVRYFASRPWCDRGRRVFPVTIQPMPGSPECATTVVIPDLNYDAANKLINGFNNGDMSFDGRVW